MTVDKYLRIKQVAELTGLSRATIYNMEKAGTFLKKTPLGARAVAWRESEIAAWMESRQHVEKSKQEKRPGKPPVKQQKSAASSGTVTTGTTSATLKASSTLDPNSTTDDWSDETPSPSSEEMDGIAFERAIRMSKARPPTKAALSRTSKDIPIIMNPPEQKLSREISVSDAALSPKKTTT